MGESVYGYFCFAVGVHEMKAHGKDHHIGGVALPRQDNGFVQLHLQQINGDLEAIRAEAHRIVDERIKAMGDILKSSGAIAEPAEELEAADGEKS